MPPNQTGKPIPGALSSDSCLFHRGPLAHPGQLILTEDTLHFEPSRTLDRITGAENFSIPVDAITELEAGGINHNLEISTDRKSYRFTGRGAIRVHSRLLSLLADLENVPEADRLFEEGERVLLQGQTELFVNDLMAIRGELTLTDQRLRFLPGFGLERLFWDTAQIDAELSELADWKLLGLRRRLALTVGGKPVVFGGTLASLLYTQLDKLVGHSEVTEDHLDQTVAETWTASLRRGLVAHEGEVSITPTHIRFTPTGLLDAMVGVKEIDIPVESITRLSLSGWPDRKLRIRAGHERYTFALSDAAERMSALAHLVRDRHYHLDRRHSNRAEPRYQEDLDRWTERLDYDHSEPISFAGLCHEGTEGQGVRFGWLLLTSTRVMFLPVGGPGSQEQHRDFPVEGICRLDGGPRVREHQINLSADGQPVRFLLTHGEGLVDEFWSKCRSPSRILTWDTLGPRSLARISGHNRFMRIIVRGEIVIDMNPGLTIGHTDGIAVVLPGEPGSSIPLGTWVTVEIGQMEGIYQFDSKVARSTVTPLDGGVPDPDATHLLVCEFPSDVRVYNLRESYRVPTRIPLRAHLLAQTADGGSWMATGDTVECIVVDLSIGGCALESKTRIQLNERLEISIPLLDQWVEIQGTCVRSGEIIEDDGAPTYGMHFAELTVAQEDLLHKAVLALQREALNEEKEDEDDSDEGSGQQ